jgi:hypothetical protein
MVVGKSKPVNLKGKDKKRKLIRLSVGLVNDSFGISRLQTLISDIVIGGRLVGIEIGMFCNDEFL